MELCNYSDLVQTLSSTDPSLIVDNLENKCYLESNFNKVNFNVILRVLQEFSSWFNSIFRINLLKCNKKELEIVRFLLINLKENVLEAIGKTVRGSLADYRLSCSVCNSMLQIEPGNWWASFQNHEHLEDVMSTVFFQPEGLLAVGDRTATSTPSETISSNSGAAGDPHPSDEPDNRKQFKFNFPFARREALQDFLYPKRLNRIVQSTDKTSVNSLQQFAKGKAMCLWCRRYYPLRGGLTGGGIKLHCMHPNHLEATRNNAYLRALTAYHSYWQSQELDCRSHQIYFVPDQENCCYCNLCDVMIPYSKVEWHVKNGGHKPNMLKFLNWPNVKMEYVELAKMQVHVYGLNANEMHMNPFNMMQPTAYRKCWIVKSFPDDTNQDIVLPVRFNQHLKFFNKRDDVIECRICELSFSNEPSFIKGHIQTARHCELAGPQLQITTYKYYCDLCKKYYNRESSWDEHFEANASRHETIAQEKNIEVAEYECKTCLRIFYGPESYISYHRMLSHKKVVKLYPAVKELFKSTTALNEEAERLMTEADSVLNCHQDMTRLSQELQLSLSDVFPNCKTYLFGSRISGLANTSSDLDIFLDTGDMYTGLRGQDSRTQQQLVRKASRFLRTQVQQFGEVVAIPTARTPIIKLHHHATNLDCDISFKHGLSVENTKFMKFCIELQPLMQPFILLLRKWAYICRLNEYLTNYAISILAIFYLQTRQHLVSVSVLRALKPQTKYVIDGWRTIDYDLPNDELRDLITPLRSDCRNLLQDFFKYFSQFDYANDVVCPLLGRPIPKSAFYDSRDLPSEMIDYVTKMQTAEGEHFRCFTPFCVQDPFDLSHNLTKAFPAGSVQTFKTLCTLTCNFLTTI